MKMTYRVLAYVVAALVAVQAAGMAWAVSGLVQFLESGGVLDFEAEGEGPLPFVELLGVIVHSMVGMYLIPLLAVVLVIIGMLSKVHGAATRALIVLGLVALQVTLGLLGGGVSFAALLHGLNALLLFSAAVYAATWMARRPTVPDTPATVTSKPVASEF